MDMLGEQNILLYPRGNVTAGWRLCWETFHVSYERSRFLSCDILSQHGREFGRISPPAPKGRRQTTTFRSQFSGLFWPLSLKYWSRQSLTPVVMLTDSSRFQPLEEAWPLLTLKMMLHSPIQRALCRLWWSACWRKKHHQMLRLAIVVVSRDANVSRQVVSSVVESAWIIKGNKR